MCENTEPMIPSALSWGGSHLLWRHMVAGARKHTTPSLAWHPNIAITSSCHKSQVLAEIYGKLNFTLVRAIARAILGIVDVYSTNEDYSVFSIIECVYVNNVLSDLSLHVDLFKNKPIFGCQIPSQY